MTQEHTTYKDRPDLWKQAARGQLSPEEYDKFLDALDMEEYTEFTKDKENRLGEKEEFLDNLVGRLSQMKVTGKPMTAEQLVGKDLDKVSELFGLEKFPKEIQAEIVTELAYLRSDAYAQRCAQSLGYNSPKDEMEPEHRAVYDRMVNSGRDAYRNITFNVIDNPLESYYHRDYDALHGDVNISSGKAAPNSTFDTMKIVSHEIAHHIYAEDDDYGINPGKNTDNDEELYGKENSPLRRITDDELNTGKFLGLYQKIFTSPEQNKLVEAAVKNGTVTKADYDANIAEVLNAKDSIPEVMSETADHDRMGRERAADVHSARMLLLHEGIWNPFSGEPVKNSDIAELRKRHPDCRIFEYWEKNVRAAYFLNNIAFNDHPKETVKELRVVERPDGSRQLLAATANGTLSAELSERDYTKLMALDAGHRDKFIGMMFPDTELQITADTQLALSPVGGGIPPTRHITEPSVLASIAFDNMEQPEYETQQSRGMRV